MSQKLSQDPAIWFPSIRVGTGADVFTRRLCEGLNERGVRAEIEWLPRRSEYFPWAVAVPKPPEWANVVHVNSWLPKRFWPTDVPIVVTVHHLVHDPEFRPYRTLWQAAYHKFLIRRRERYAIRQADAVTTVSDYVRRTVTRFSGRDQVSVIHNWVDGDRFRPDALQAPRESRPFRILIAGSRSKRKGIELMSDFANALGPGFEVRYAGARVGRMSSIVGVTELGRISEDELIQEYKACDVVVSLSRYEGFGYTALEALACGKPFLGFDTSALPEVVTDECGMLVEVDNILALAAAVREMRASPERLSAKGQCGRDRAISCFSQNQIDAYVATYSMLSARRRQSHLTPT